jgi:hypothetical protein
MSEKAADALVQLWADDVLELASLIVQFGVINGESVFEKPLRESMPPDNVASAPAAARRQLYLSILQFDQLQF